MGSRSPGADVGGASPDHLASAKRPMPDWILYSWHAHQAPPRAFRRRMGRRLPNEQTHRPVPANPTSSREGGVGRGARAADTDRHAERAGGLRGAGWGGAAHGAPGSAPVGTPARTRSHAAADHGADPRVASQRSWVCGRARCTSVDAMAPGVSPSRQRRWPWRSCGTDDVTHDALIQPHFFFCKAWWLAAAVECKQGGDDDDDGGGGGGGGVGGGGVGG